MSAILQRTQTAWEDFWFTPGPPLDLAVARILLSGTSLWILLSRDLPALSGVPAEFWSTVSRSFMFRYLLFPGHESLERALQWLTILCLTTTLLGVWSRGSAFASGLLLSHFAPLESFQWSSSAFTWSIPVLGLFFVAAAPCDDALSILQSRRIRSVSPSWAHRWPVQMVRVQLAMLYFFSAYSKMLHAGPSWAAPEHMQAWMLGFYQREHPVFTSFAPWMAEHPLLCGAVGLLGLGVEAAFPFALFYRRLRWVLLPVTLMMHLGIVLTLNITVLYWPVLFVLVDWQAVVEWSKRRRRTAVPTPPATRSAIPG